MRKIVIGGLAIAAMLAFALYAGARDGREHRSGAGTAAVGQ
jgi:hypothetical protein